MKGLSGEEIYRVYHLDLVVHGGVIGNRECLEPSNIVKLYLEVARARIGTLLIAPEANMTLFQIGVKDQHLIDTAFALVVEVNNCKSLFHADCQTLTWQNARCPGVNASDWNTCSSSTARTVLPKINLKARRAETLCFLWSRLRRQ